MPRMMALTEDCRIPCSANFRFTEFYEVGLFSALLETARSFLDKLAGY